MQKRVNACSEAITLLGCQTDAFSTPDLKNNLRIQKNSARPYKSESQILS